MVEDIVPGEPMIVGRKCPYCGEQRCMTHCECGRSGRAVGRRAPRPGPEDQIPGMPLGRCWNKCVCTGSTTLDVPTSTMSCHACTYRGSCLHFVATTSLRTRGFSFVSNARVQGVRSLQGIPQCTLIPCAGEPFNHYHSPILCEKVLNLL